MQTWREHCISCEHPRLFARIFWDPEKTSSNCDQIKLLQELKGTELLEIMHKDPGAYIKQRLNHISEIQILVYCQMKENLGKSLVRQITIVMVRIDLCINTMKWGPDFREFRFSCGSNRFGTFFSEKSNQSNFLFLSIVGAEDRKYCPHHHWWLTLSAESPHFSMAASPWLWMWDSKSFLSSPNPSVIRETRLYIRPRSAIINKAYWMSKLSVLF